MSQFTNSSGTVEPSPTDLSSFLTFANALADVAGDVLRPRFRANLDVDNKAAAGDFDPVTEADRLVERELRERIEKEFPDHSILGEEYGPKSGRASYTWVLDPIDGTRSFISGTPLWGTLIALNDGSRPLIGIVDQPYLGERFVGVHARGRSIAELRIAGNARALTTRSCEKLSDAILTCTDPVMFTEDKELSAYRSVEQGSKLVRYSMDCYGYCLLALGSIDLVVEAGLAPYDIQALIPIIEAAGGIVTDWNGNLPVNGGQIIAAGDARVHDEALRLLSGAAKPTL